MKKYIVFLILITCFSISCKNKSTENSEEKQAAQLTEVTVSLTAEQMKMGNITLGSIEQKELSSVVKANGMVSVLNQNKALISAPYGGTVKTINIHAGDVVKSGDVIATIINPYFITLQEEYLTVLAQLNAGSAEEIASVANTQFANVQEQYNTLQPQIILAEKEVQRQKELNTGNAGSTKNLQQAESNLASLKAKSNILSSQMSVFGKNAETVLRTKKAALESKLKLMGVTPSVLTPENMQSVISVRTPIGGKVGEIQAKIGSYINENTAITEVINLNDLHLDLNVYEADIAKFHIGQRINFVVTNNPTQTYAADVHTIGAMLNPETKTVEIHAHIEGSKTGLIEGMNVMATVNLGKTKVNTVPNDAIVREEGQDFVFTLESQNDKETIFEKIPIRKGVTEGNFTEITFVNAVSPNIKIATSQAFFILGKINNTGEE